MLARYKGILCLIVGIVAIIIAIGLIIISQQNLAVVTMIENDQELFEIDQFMKELQTKESLVMQNTDSKPKIDDVSDAEMSKSNIELNTQKDNEIRIKDSITDSTKTKYLKKYNMKEIKKIYQINDNNLIQEMKNGKTLNSLIESGNYSWYVPIVNFENKKGEINIKKSLTSHKLEVRELYVGSEENCIAKKSDIEKILKSEMKGKDNIGDIKYINVTIDNDSFLIACGSSEMGKEYIVPIHKDSDNCPMKKGIVYDIDEMVENMEYYYAQNN